MRIIEVIDSLESSKNMKEILNKTKLIDRNKQVTRLRRILLRNFRNCYCRLQNVTYMEFVAGLMKYALLKRKYKHNLRYT